MKKIFLSAIIALLPAFLYSADNETSYPVVTREFCKGREISSIELSTNIIGTLVKSDETKVVLEVDERIEPWIHLSYEDGKVDIWYEAPTVTYESNNWFKILGIKFSGRSVQRKEKLYDDAKPARVTIYTPSVSKIELSGAVELRSEDTFETGKLVLDLSGASELDLTVHADDVAADFSGAAEVELKGSGRKVVVDVSGAAEVDMSRFKAWGAVVEASGSADIDIFAEETLSVDASGAAEVKYSGDAKITKKEASGAAHIKKY